MEKKRIIILSVHSFFNDGAKVGIQYIAEGLSKRGWLVDYVSITSSPFDSLFPDKRPRFRRVWKSRQDLVGKKVSDNLFEFSFRSFFPPKRNLFLNSTIDKIYTILKPAWIREKIYDFCLHDICVNVLFVPCIKAKHYVLRLNDSPEGFSHVINQRHVDLFRKRITDRAYTEIWAVSKRLTEYVNEINGGCPVFHIPNGMSQAFIDKGIPKPISKYRAVYVGGNTAWLDLDLLIETATILPEWEFHIYGPFKQSASKGQANIKIQNPINSEWLPSILPHYSVGMIPFKDVDDRMRYVERPMKFYEYVGAGIGVASTDIGSLRSGMGPWAQYGNTPKEFANAIVKAESHRDKASIDDRMAFFNASSWERVMAQINERLLQK